MDHLYIEISSENGAETEFFTTIKSFTALYVYLFLEKPKTIKLCFVLSKNLHNFGKIKLNSELLKRELTENDIICNDSTSEQHILDLHLPLYGKNGDTFIAGMCAVCREIIHQSDKKELLGFKESCLLAPAEASIWTRYFEVDIVRVLCGTLTKIENNIECSDFPIECVHFENHMNEPVRMHNIYKLARERANEQGSSNVEDNDGHRKKVTIECKIPKEQLAIDHKFAEGVSFTIADLILYPYIRIIFHCYTGMLDKFPLTKRWLHEVDDFEPKCAHILKECCIFPSGFAKTGCWNLPKCDAFSLYKSDPKRYKPRNRIFTEQKEVDVALNKLQSLGISFNSISDCRYDQFNVDWDHIEPSHAVSSALPINRLERKRQQLENLANAVVSLSNPGYRIIDFCSGTGHLGLLLALQLPECTVILLENKPFSLQKAKERARELNLRNVKFYQSNIDYFNGHFDIGCSLHACGTATDIVLAQCHRVKAMFVTCPCCYGSLQPMPHIKYPLSKEFRSVLTEKEFLYIAHTADQAHALGTLNCSPETTMQGQLCMDIVDTDRKLQAENIGYKVTLTRLKPENCTPKNRLLVGKYCNDN
ncbi:glutathione S-transferase C-terminal domain-containing protein homolog [Stomoxys calcitrans]|uniref:glutathione S-transferase C-terminal domain-containing protein homolog n=1 Tax=Stomoxys calcitrans TaxID=35570 RepID=UPI0027E36DF8|nr:glutathione S-transferase C-terminal domain-containing protein homolog [Stomoxys calcitrans]